MSKIERLEAICTSGHVTSYPTDSPFSLCEEEGGPRALWRCAEEGCGAKLMNYREVGATSRYVENSGGIGERKVVSEIDAFLADIDVIAEAFPKPSVSIGLAWSREVEAWVAKCKQTVEDIIAQRGNLDVTSGICQAVEVFYEQHGEKPPSWTQI